MLIIIILHLYNLGIMVDESIYKIKNYDYEHAFLCILNFYTFLSSFQSCFLHICTAWAMSSFITSSISISAGENRLKAVLGEPNKNELQGHEWRVVTFVTHHEYSVVGSHSPAQLWSWVCTPRFAMTMENTSASGIWVEVICHFQIEVLFSCPIIWNADIMTGTGTAILDQR